MGFLVRGTPYALAEGVLSLPRYASTSSRQFANAIESSKIRLERECKGFTDILRACLIVLGQPESPTLHEHSKPGNSRIPNTKVAVRIDVVRFSGPEKLAAEEVELYQTADL
jgi:hypothetical protein